MILSLFSGVSIIWLLVWTLFLAGVLKVLFLLLRKWKEDEDLKDFPAPPGHWLYGNAHEEASMEKGLHNYKKWLNTYGSPYRLQIGPFRSMVVLADPDCMRTILSTTEPKQSLQEKVYGPWIGDGLLFTKGKKWHRHRRLLTPAFHFQILKPYVNIFNTSTHIMMDKWRESLESRSRYEMFSEMSLMVLDSLLKCAFGSKGSIQRDKKENPYITAMIEVSELVMRRLGNPLIHPDFLFYLTYDGYRMRKACRTIHQYSQNVIQLRKKAKKDPQLRLSGQSKKYLDFLDILLEAVDTDGTGLTDQEIQNEVDTFMFEGHDTTASALSWFLYNMARHPEHQNKCVEEIRDVLGERDDVTWDDLTKFKYMTLCMQESMRLHSTVSNTARHTTKPLTFPNGLSVPKDTWVHMNIYGLHHNPKVWKDPERYDPLRFTPENSKHRSPYAYIPFAAGPRNCIGQNFALCELRTCGALLLKHFEFFPQEDALISEQVILKPINGIWLKVKERKSPLCVSGR